MFIKALYVGHIFKKSSNFTKEKLYLVNFYLLHYSPWKYDKKCYYILLYKNLWTHFFKRESLGIKVYTKFINMEDSQLEP